MAWRRRDGFGATISGEDGIAGYAVEHTPALLDVVADACPEHQPRLIERHARPDAP